MKIASVPSAYRKYFVQDSDDVLDVIDVTSPPKRRRRRRRPGEDVGTASTIFPKAPTIPEYVSERNPHGTEYVQRLIELIDSGKLTHELDDRRRPRKKSSLE